MSLESFKSFVRGKPGLIKYVESKEKTWQDFYDMYELYGEDSSVWNRYSSVLNNTSSAVTIKDVFNTFSNMNMEELQKGITSLQKGIGYLEEIFSNRQNATSTSNYEPRQIYKRLDD